MKIILSNYDDIKNPYYGGGGAYAIFEVAKRLAITDNVMVVTGKYPGSKDEILDNVKFKRIGLSWLPAKLAQLVFQLILPFYAATLKYDVWLESFTPPYSTAFLPIFTRKPVIGLTHILSGRAMFEKYRIPFHLIENFGLKFYKHCVVLNDEIKKQIRKSNPKINIHVIPNGVDKKLIDSEFEKKGDNILFLGRIDINQKGLDLLLDAYKSVADKMPEELVIAGAGANNEVTWIKNRIKELGLESKVKYIGKVSGIEKEDAFKRAKIFVMSSRFEALPLTILEAFSYKCALVYFGIDVFDWIKKDMGVRVKPFEVKAFGDSLLSLSQDNNKAAAIGNAAKIYVKNFSWDKISDQYRNAVILSIKNGE